MIIHDIWQRPDFVGTHEVLIVHGNGVKGIKDGAYMALQLGCETRDPAVSVVGALPRELHAWLDAISRSPRAAPTPKRRPPLSLTSPAPPPLRCGRRMDWRGRLKGKVSCASVAVLIVVWR